jgi:hypothetical protein
MGKSAVEVTLSRLRPDLWQTIFSIYALSWPIAIAFIEHQPSVHYSTFVRERTMTSEVRLEYG